MRTFLILLLSIVLLPMSTAWTQSAPVDRDLKVKLTQPQLIDRVEKRQRKLRQALNKLRGYGDERNVLAAEVEASKQQLADRDATFAKTVKLLADAIVSLEPLREVVPVAQLVAAQDALTRGDETLAERLFQELKKASDKPKTNTANVAYRLGRLAENRAEFETAYAYYRTATADEPDNAAYHNATAVIAQRMRRFDEAEPHHLRVLELNERAFGPEHQEVANTLGTLAWLHIEQLHHDKAIPLYQRALGIFEKIHGRGHETVAETLYYIGYAYRRLDRYHDAEHYYLQALTVEKTISGPKHPSVAGILTDLGHVYEGQDRFEEAEESFLKALAIQEDAFGPDHTQVAVTKFMISNFYKRIGDSSKAYRMNAEFKAIIRRQQRAQ